MISSYKNVEIWNVIEFFIPSTRDNCLRFNTLIGIQYYNYEVRTLSRCLGNSQSSIAVLIWIPVWVSLSGPVYVLLRVLGRPHPLKTSDGLSDKFETVAEADSFYKQRGSLL